MNKNLVYKILYYVCFVFTLSLIFFLTRLNEDLYFNMATNYQLFMIVINIVLVIIFSIKLKDNKLKKISTIFPVIYLLFLIIVVTMMFVMNSKLILSYVHFGYYTSFILFDYLLLNIYSVLSLKKGR